MRPPLIPRRRSRRRSVSGRLIFLICALIVTALVIGGLTQVSRQSGPYEAVLNRSIAAQATVLAVQSNVTAAEVRTLMADLPTQGRDVLQAKLDGVVQQSALQASRASTLATPQLSAGVPGELPAVFAQRAEAVRHLRSAVDGLLGLRPLPVVGSPPGGAPVAASPTLLSSTAATDRIAAAGALLTRADRSYRAIRRALAHGAGHATLPASTWVPNPQVWQTGSVATQVDQMSASSSLAGTHRLVLSTVALSPPALPNPSGVASPTISVLSPTSTVTVSVVLSDQGSVDEPHAAVQFIVTPLSGGTTVTRTRTTAIASGTSIALAPVTLHVKPGRKYQLTVSIVLPAGQIDGTQTSVSQQLQIAPAT